MIDKTKLKTIEISGKCTDRFGAQGYDKDKKELFDYDGYVPRIFGGGDYIEMKIDVETGQILNWKKPTQEDLDELFGEEEEEEE